MLQIKENQFAKSKKELAEILNISLNHLKSIKKSIYYFNVVNIAQTLSIDFILIKEKTVLSVASELSEKLQYPIKDNIGNEFDKNTSYNYSLYIETPDCDYRISNHELPNRRYMQMHPYINGSIAREKGAQQLYRKNNIEYIVKEGEIVVIYENFN